MMSMNILELAKNFSIALAVGSTEHCISFISGSLLSSTQGPSEDLHCLKIIEIPEKIIVSDFLHARCMILIVLHVAFHQYHPKTVLEFDYFIIYHKKLYIVPKNHPFVT